MNPKPDKLWTPKDLADFLSIEESVVRYWVRMEEVPCVRLGRQIRFVSDDILDWVWAKGNGRNTVQIKGLGRV